MRTLFLVTVDCDLRTDHMGARQAALQALLDVFADEGLAGQVTWFLNENDFCLTEHQEAFLHEAVTRGDGIGIHDHLEALNLAASEGAPHYRASSVLAYCRASREGVARWLERNGYAGEIRAHRNGCLTQAMGIYEALGELGYTVLSDVWPRHRSTDRRGHPAQDNTALPLGIGAYRHDAHNFSDFASTSGRFLQVPVAAVFLGSFEPGMLERWLGAAEQQGAEPAVFTWCLHPYEVLNDNLDAVSPGMVEVLRDHLRRIRAGYEVEFARLTQLEEIVG
ncbi:MAG: hypothetical protein AB7Y46_14350 [Armatimonadota bacterium]